MLDSILSFIGKGIDAFSSSSSTDKKIAAEKELQAQNIANQREFAQQGIRWKVADAQAAGLHPLAALGAQTSSFSNVVGGNYEIPKTDFGGMGQDIGRAIEAGSTQSERTDRMGAAIARTAQVFQLERLNLENEVLKTQVMKNVAQLGPALPGSVPLSALAHLSRSPQRTREGHAISDDEIKQQASDAPKVSKYAPLGIKLEANPAFSDSDVVTSRLGESEPLEMLTWLANMIGDIKYTAQRKSGFGRGNDNPFDKVPPRRSRVNKPPRMFPYFF